MKRSFNFKYHLLIIILFGIIVLESLLLLVTLGNTAKLQTMVSDMQSIITIFVFIIFVYLVVMYNYIPFRTHKAIKELHSIVDEISNGNYNIDIDSSMYDQDKDIQDLILSLQKMLVIIGRFDQVKADKIFEHHQRIQQLINLISDHVIITSNNGDVIYCNESFRKDYPSINEMSNLNELIFKEDFNRRLFDTILDSLRYGNNLYDNRISDASGTRCLIVNGSIVRNRKGMSSGAVFILGRCNETPKN